MPSSVLPQRGRPGVSPPQARGLRLGIGDMDRPGADPPSTTMLNDGSQDPRRIARDGRPCYTRAILITQKPRGVHARCQEIGKAIPGVIVFERQFARGEQEPAAVFEAGSR